MSGALVAFGGARFVPPLCLFLFFGVPKQPKVTPTSEIFCQIRPEELFLLLVVIQEDQQLELAIIEKKSQIDFEEI